MLQRSFVSHRCSHRGRPRVVHTKAAAAASSAGGSTSSSKRYRLRQARVEDAAAVSEVMAEVGGASAAAGHQAQHNCQLLLTTLPAQQAGVSWVEPQETKYSIGCF